MWFSRLFVRLLVLGMLPVVLLASTGAAEAAPIYGDAASASFSTGDGLGDHGVSCEVVGYFAGSADYPATIHADMSCSTGFNVKQAVTGWTVDGGSCDYAWSPEEVDGRGKLSNVLAAAPGYDVAGCVVTELCWTVDRMTHSGLWNNESLSGCVPFALGAPPNDLTPATCAKGDVARPKLGPTALSSDPRFSSAPLTLNVASLVGPASDWAYYVVFGGGNKSLHTWVTQARDFATGVPVSPSARFVADYSAVHPVGAFPHTVSLQMTSRNDSPPVTSWSVVGVGVVNLATLGSNTGMGTSARRTSLQWLTQETEPGGVFGQVGITNPANCAFYWGDKVASTPADDYDEPKSSLTAPAPNPGTSTPPAVSDPAPQDGGGCAGFSVSDPASWAGAGICMVVQLLSWILDTLDGLVAAVGGIVTGILGGIGAVLQGLFVPTVPISERLDNMRTTFDNRAPFSWLQEIATVSTSIPQGEMVMATTSAREVPGSAAPAFQAASQVPEDGCPSWNIEVAGWNQNVICGSSYTQAIRDLRPVIFGMMALLALWPLVRGTYYASIPVLSVKPSDPVA